MSSSNIYLHIISRKKAKELNLKFYFTGKPCKHGHICGKYTSSGECIECMQIKNTSGEKKEYNKEYRSNSENKARHREYLKEYRSNSENKARHREYMKDWSSKSENKAKKKEYDKEYYSNNKARRNEYIKEYNKQRRKEDPDFRLTCNMRDILRRILKATSQDKDSSTSDLLGYTSSQLRSHLESLFLPGMSWDNTDEWHIDHIYPVTKFIQDGVTDPSIINALSNLRPMWKEDNISKKDLLFEEWKELYPNRAELYE